MLIAVIVLSACFALAIVFLLVYKLANVVRYRAIAYYIIKKGYTPPTDEEVRECTDYVIKNMFKNRNDL